MKKTYLITFLFSLLNILLSYSQITTNEKPISIQKGLEDITKNTIAQSGSLIDLPIPDMQKVYREDAEREKDSVALQRTSVPIFVSLDMSQYGRWTSIKDGGKLWQLGIRAKDAKAIDFVFDKFWLPDGGKFFIFNPNTNETIGAVTSRYLRGSKAEPSNFSTGIVKGDTIILEYYQPSEISEMPNVCISKVYYTYIDPTPNYSCSYNVNVNCSEGDNWQDEKRAVALVYFKFNQGGSWGSGALINNTQNNFVPLFLTANHNLEYDGNLIEIKDAIDDPDLSESIFYWNFENQICDSSMPAFCRYSTTTGAIVKSNNSFYADFALLELIENPWNLPDYIPYHLGWNRSTDYGTGGVCIHHPWHDYKKISTYSMTPISLFNTYLGVTWIATTNGHGITEPISSGAPLINNGHRVIGQLYGGDSGCNNLTGMDKFGKLSVSWTGNGNSDSRRRLKDWLDPLNSNMSYLNGIGSFNIVINNSNCSQTIYRIDYLPTNWTVSWSFTSPYSYPSGLLQTNTPQTNQCTINNPNNAHLIGTLKASIHNTYGSWIANRTINIDTGSGFAGTYSQIDNFNVIPHNIPETSFSDGQTLVVGPKCDVYIRSFCFPGTTITHTGANLSLWEYSNDLGYGVIHLKFLYSSNTQYLTIKAVDNTNCKIYEFYVNAVPYSPINFDPILSASTNGQRLNVTLGVKSDETDVETTYDVSEENVKWDIVICNALTGKVMYENRVEGWSQEIDTTGWPAGIYIIKAQAGEHFVTQKISIK